jgi:hypothetical protein
MPIVQIPISSFNIPLVLSPLLAREGGMANLVH